MTKVTSKILIFVIYIAICPNIVHAKPISALELQQYCNESQKGAVGKPFDQGAAEQCAGYMQGFFDSMIVVERYAGVPLFCIPPSLPTSQNTAILDAWIADNSKIASETTASVALFAALNRAFPCEAKAQ